MKIFLRQILVFFFLASSIYSGPDNLSPANFKTEKLLNEEIHRKISAIRSFILNNMSLTSKKHIADEKRSSLKTGKPKVNLWSVLSVNPQSTNGSITPVSPVFPVYLKPINKEYKTHTEMDSKKKSSDKDNFLGTQQSDTLIKTLKSMEYSEFRKLIELLLYNPKNATSIKNSRSLIANIKIKLKQIQLSMKYLTGDDLLTEKIIFRILQDELNMLLKNPDINLASETCKSSS